MAKKPLPAAQCLPVPLRRTAHFILFVFLFRSCSSSSHTGGIPYAVQSLHQLFEEDLAGWLGSLHKHELILERTGNEIEYGAPCDTESPHAPHPYRSGKTPKLWGAPPSPAPLESSFRVYEAAGTAQMTKFGCFYFCPAANTGEELQTTPSLPGAKLPLFLASAMVLGSGLSTLALQAAVGGS